MKKIILFLKKKLYRVKGQTMNEAIRNVLTNLNYNYSTLKIDEEENIINLTINLKYGTVDSYIINNKAKKYIEVRNLCSITIPELKRREIAEFIVRTNNILTIGRFDLNMENGDLFFGAANLYDDSLPQSEEVFNNILSFSYQIMEEYVPSVMNIIYTHTLAEKEIFKTNNKVDPSWN